MDLLTVAQYDSAERAATASLPNRVIEVAGSAVFEKLGYPTRITLDHEAARYVDVMHEGRAWRDIDELLGGMTSDELRLVIEVNKVVASMSRQVYGVRRFATGSLVRALHMYRNLNTLFPGNKPAVFEIGPGSGYLGALLLLAGHQYYATDVTQAMYIYQNHLWNHIAPGKVHELATATGPVQYPRAETAPMAIHIPWWRFYSMYLSEQAPAVDVVTANHVLCEMPEHACAYAVQIGAKLLSGAKSRFFAFEGWGYPRVHPYSVYLHFARAGYVLRRESAGLTLFEHTGDATSTTRLSRAMQRLRQQSGKAFGLAPALPSGLAKRSREIEKALRVSLHAGTGQRIHNSTEVKESLTRALGIPDLATQDEQFSDFIGRTY